MASSRRENRASPVSRHDSEALIAAVENSLASRAVAAGEPIDRRAGIFGPHSMFWRINRESALFLGAGRAALLQLAHPWVATALQQHSSVMSNPIVRFHNTFRIVFAMIFGSVDQAVAATRHLYTLHTRIQGEMPHDIAAYARGSHYEANEIAALRWVFATLIETAVLAYECIAPPLTASELGAYYAETRTLAALFGIPPAALPNDWPAFLAYCRDMEQSAALGVTDEARVMAHNLLAGTNAWIKPPHWYRSLTTSWLCPRFRTEFALPFGPLQQRATLQAKQRLPLYYPRLPGALRFVGPWHEAQARLQGRSAGILARLGNRFWIGQPLLPSANHERCTHDTDRRQ